MEKIPRARSLACTRASTVRRTCRAHWRASVRRTETEKGRGRERETRRGQVASVQFFVSVARGPIATRVATARDQSRPATVLPRVRAIGRMRRVAAIGGERAESAARASRRSASSFVAARPRVRSCFARVSLRSSSSDTDGHRAPAYLVLFSASSSLAGQRGSTRFFFQISARGPSPSFPEISKKNRWYASEQLGIRRWKDETGEGEGTELDTKHSVKIDWKLEEDLRGETGSRWRARSRSMRTERLSRLVATGHQSSTSSFCNAVTRPPANEPFFATEEEFR